MALFLAPPADSALCDLVDAPPTDCVKAYTLCELEEPGLKDELFERFFGPGFSSLDFMTY